MAIEDRPAMETPQHWPGREITDDLDVLLDALPPAIADSIRRIDNRANLLEIVMDLGRQPSARFPGREVILSEREVTREDLDLVTSRIGEFGSDNRAGIERTLHRISAMRNRKGEIVGLTCRIGRAVYGTITIIRDLVETGRSILLLGRPGVGKTTLLRDIARVLADEFNKRVVIVDTSNEIAGDGDIPHPAIGRARRMQVAIPEKQHAVMIEAVENHMPEAIVIDEIGTELEAAAARTIAERGVQLVGTAHGNTLENLMLNPTLSDLIGGIQTVTLGDEEARRRGTQKSILERKAPPTFEIIVEIQSWERVAVHESVADAVDALLRGHPAPPQVRQLDANGNVVQETLALPRPSETYVRGDVSRRDRRHAATNGGSRPVGGFERHPTQDQSGLSTPLVNERPAAQVENIPAPQQPLIINPIPPSALAPEPGISAILNNPDRLTFERSADEELNWFQDIPAEEAVERVRESGRVIPARNWAPTETIRPSRVYPYGISQTKLEEAAAEMQLPITVAKDVQDADLVMTLRNYYKRKPSPIREAESLGVPVYVLKSNTTLQMEQCLAHIYDLDLPLDPVSVAMQETEDAIDRMMSGQDKAVELSPQNAYIRRLQHQMAEKYNLTTRSRGREPHRRVRLIKEK